VTVFDETWRAQLTEPQRAVAEQILAGRTGVHLLSAPAGSGKSFMAASVAASLLREPRRILIVAPTVLSEELALRAAGDGNHPIFEITKADVRIGSRQKDWPADAIGIVRPKALHFRPLLEHIAETKWGFAIVDDDRVDPDTVGAIQELLRRDVLERVLVLAASPADAGRWRLLSQVEETVWKPPSFLVAWEPEALVTFESLTYRRDGDEVRLLHQVERLVEEFGEIPELGLEQLPIAGASSSFALQAQALRIFHRVRAARNAAAHGELHLESEETLVDPGTLVRLTRDLERIVVSVDELDHDAKLTAVLTGLADTVDSRRIVFFASADTARYVADGLRLQRADFLLLDRKTSGAKLDHDLRQSGTLILAVDRNLFGRDLRSVQVAVNYDLPPTLQQAYLRLSRLGAEPDAKRSISVLTPIDESHASAWEERQLDQLGLRRG
jgi:hypothetical protein